MEENPNTTNVSPADLAVAERQEWQFRQIEESIREAEVGDFASDEEVAAVFAR